MYPKAGEADKLKMASNCTGDMLMPKAFVLLSLQTTLPIKQHEIREFPGQSSGISLWASSREKKHY